MAQDMWDKPDEWLDDGPDGAESPALALGVLRRRTAEVCAHVREQGARARRPAARSSATAPSRRVSG
ncbi:hypothetical protein GCM10010495_65660 [Kitasatospora herbaricolor]|uniref:hypothetical protein n=1 Tax=Kitasatospora herbaricolor TaxID=68217 RepID=UPI00174B2D45|nr:hypothetical protein [Kitasatospora herbaricolor]MDQ0313407.1 hypothetical protein [Kitasatospora herbaricolor]GGV39190.1 hypothetical protein GCM10010495_65660 [Kitasatospora herbaricolor]